MLDALEKVSKLSQALQLDNCSLPRAYQVLKRTIRALKCQKEGSGVHYQVFQDVELSGTCKGVTLSSKGNTINQAAFLQALIDNLGNRLYTNPSFTSSELDELLSQWSTTLQNGPLLQKARGWLVKSSYSIFVTDFTSHLAMCKMVFGIIEIIFLWSPHQSSWHKLFWIPFQ